MKVDSSVGYGFAESTKFAAEAEEFGYDGVFTAEVKHDPFIPLAMAAPQTSRIELGTSIAVAFARTPMTLAYIANDLQIASQGRFVLGLGTQIKAHITRRFSMPWSHPAARMREFVLAMRAIWESWEQGTKLDFRGDFYEHTLMTPFFNPGSNEFGGPRVFLAAVGELMTKTAGEVCDGMLCHGFTTESYLREVTMRALGEGFAAGGRTRADVQLSLPAFVVTGTTEEEMAAAAAGVREQIAFYGSTPAYRGVLEHHGWGELQTELNALSKQGEWQQMGTLIDDEILGTFAVVAEPDRVGDELLARFGDLVDRVSFYAPYQASAGAFAPAIEQLRSA